MSCALFCDHCIPNAASRGRVSCKCMSNSTLAKSRCTSPLPFLPARTSRRILKCNLNLSHPPRTAPARIQPYSRLLTLLLRATQLLIFTHCDFPGHSWYITMESHIERMQATKKSLKVYKQLQLRPDQRECFARRWRSWCRRRRKLDEQLRAALFLLKV